MNTLNQALFAVLPYVALAVFFLFLYDFDAKRFLVYLVWPAGLLISDSLGRLRGRAGFAAGAAAPTVPAETSRMNPSLSSFVTSCWKPWSQALPTFAATSCSVARPSIAERTARSGLERRLVFPAASWTPLPDFE